MKRALVAVLVGSLFAVGCAMTPKAGLDSERELQQLESAKWSPPALGSQDEFLALFADDFVSVEYGANVTGGAVRKTRSEVFAGEPLPPAKFDLSDWHFVHANPTTVIVSYRVTALTFGWRAYATSVWTRRNGRWQTVFYQASTAA